MFLKTTQYTERASVIRSQQQIDTRIAGRDFPERLMHILAPGSKPLRPLVLACNIPRHAAAGNVLKATSKLSVGLAPFGYQSPPAMLGLP